MPETKEYVTFLKDQAALTTLLRELKEENIGYAFLPGSKYPMRVHIILNKGRATLRQIED